MLQMKRQGDTWEGTEHRSQGDRGKTGSFSPEMWVAEYVGTGIPGLCHTEQVGRGQVSAGCLEEARGQDVYLEEGVF